jgi:ferredoxin-fold anticodon binding domain-containing protein
MKKKGVKHVVQNYKNGVKIGTVLKDIFANYVITQKQGKDQK